MDIFETNIEDEIIPKVDLLFYIIFVAATGFNFIFYKPKTLTFGFLKEDYLQFLYMLQGFLRIEVYPLKNRLCNIQEIKTKKFDNLNGNFELFYCLKSGN